jgi:hypothetical protein
MKVEVKNFDMDDSVVCDLCNGDYTGSPALGGFVFGSSAVCPACSPSMLKDIEECGEGEHIRMRALEGETFQHMVLRFRNGDNSVMITSWVPGEETGPYPWGREEGDE